MLEIRKEPTHPNPRPPSLPAAGEASFQSSHLFLLFAFLGNCLVSFTFPFPHAHLVPHLVLSPNLFFIPFLVPVRVGSKVILNYLYLYPSVVVL